MFTYLDICIQDEDVDSLNNVCYWFVYNASTEQTIIIRNATSLFDNICCKIYQTNQQ